MDVNHTSVSPEFNAFFHRQAFFDLIYEAFEVEDFKEVSNFSFSIDITSPKSVKKLLLDKFPIQASFKNARINNKEEVTRIGAERFLFHYKIKDKKYCCLAKINKYTPQQIIFRICSNQRRFSPILKKLKSVFSKYIQEPVGREEISASITYYDGSVCKKSKRLNCEKWKEKKQNYPSKTRKSLNEIIKKDVDSEKGNLMIFHGDPGTGKTHFLKSLIRNFSNNHDYHPNIVTDVRKFFSVSEYYFNILENKKKNIVILEDAADTLLDNTKSRNAELVSKALNFTDGIVSQDDETIFIITFNESIDEINDAFKRYGRLHSIVEFKKFNEEEANEWLESHGSNYRVDERKTLSELYEIIDPDTQTEDSELVDKESESLGF